MRVSGGGRDQFLGLLTKVVFPDVVVIAVTLSAKDDHLLIFTVRRD